MVERTRRLVGLAILVGALVAALGARLPAAGQPGRPTTTSPAEQDFIRQHWRRPIAPQGPPPPTFSPQERSLEPAACGACHPVQFGDWRTSIHAQSMGPGIAGQLVELLRAEPATARSCFACHAPLAEQSPLIRTDGGLVTNPVHDADLQRQGVVCASCHVRGHQRFGPPRRDGSIESRAPRDRLPHNGLTRTRAFLRAEFCASCHQFAPDGFAVNGKLLENTFEEWRASPAAREGRQCQDCHMPDRRHLWRGIHDPEMVRSGVKIDMTTDRRRYQPGEMLSARIAVRSVRVGHAFPTYVTPRVVVRAELLDASGERVPGGAVEEVIGRQVPLDLSREIADTRIPAGGQFAMRYSRRLDAPGLRLRVTVTVYPDHFYTGFFEALLEGGAGAGEAQIREALAATRRSAFVLFEREIRLT